MKFLICGLGSIGQRHVRMIRQATGGDAQIAALRLRGLDIVIDDKLQATEGVKPEDHYGLTVFTNWEDALAWQPDAMFVTNPISMHVETALRGAEAGCHLFIEKPLDCTNEKVGALKSVVADKGLACTVAYQLRYHPAYRRLEELIQSGTLGRLIAADLHFGEWLPGMHPYEDYKESHAARADQGGGVILCLSHEIDIAYWLFGPPKSLVAFGGHLSDLEMDVEDTADILMRCEHGGRDYPVHVHLDFLQKPARRYIHVAGDKGAAVLDYTTSKLEIRLIGAEAPEVISYDGFQRNDMFVGEVSDFIEAAMSGRTPPLSLEDGAAVLDICLAAKRSLETGKPEVLK